jgi:hypothetical protein
MSRGLNGETVFTAHDVLVGYTRNRMPVTVSVRMEALDRQDSYETTEHEQVTKPLDFAITSAVWKRDRSDIESSTAGPESLQEVINSGRYADGWDAGKVQALIGLGPWHLSAMSAGCVHQTPVYANDRYGRNVPSLDQTPPCPITGYRYGHSWLVRVLPDGFLRNVQRLFA